MDQKNSKHKATLKLSPKCKGSSSKSLGQKWTRYENQIYLAYLEEYFCFFKTKSLRKKYEVFSNLGKKLKNRSSKQVKTHHNKMIQRYRSIQKILQCLPKTLQQTEESVNKEESNYEQKPSQQHLIQDSKYTITIINNCQHSPQIVPDFEEKPLLLLQIEEEWPFFLQL